MSTKPKAYSYIRFSSTPQEKGDSVRRQTEYSTKYAEKHGLELDDKLNLWDLGRSAFDGSNIEKGALGGFLHAVKEGQIPRGSYLLVESLDRISRAQVMQALAVFTQIINGGVIIVTLADEMIYSAEKLANDPMPLIMSIMVMIRAHEESLSKSKRMKQAWEGKRKQLAATKLTRTCPSWMELNEKRTAFNLLPDRVKVVRRILQMQNDGIGQSRIVRTLNQEKVAPIQTRVPTESWHASTIQKILTNPALYGAYQPTIGLAGKIRIPHGDPIEGYYPALISKDEFILQQRARRDRATRGRGVKGEAFTNLFSGLLRCGMCGGAMTVAGHAPIKGVNKRYLVCSRAKRGLGCNFVMWTLNLFEKMILAYCDELDFSKLLDESSGSASLVLTQHEIIDSHRGRRQEQAEKLERLLTAIEEGDAPTAVLARIREIEGQIADLENKITLSERNLAEMMALRQDSTEIKKSIINLFAQFEAKQGNELFELRAKVAAQLKRVVAEIEVFPGGYYMNKEDWDDFTKGISKREIKEQCLDQMLIPEKKYRFAIIKGINGRRFPTHSLSDARFKKLQDKVELLERLGIQH